MRFCLENIACCVGDVHSKSDALIVAWKNLVKNSQNDSRRVRVSVHLVLLCPYTKSLHFKIQNIVKGSKK
jgi:hypothetical protein